MDEDKKAQRREYMREYMRQYRKDPEKGERQYRSGRRRIMRLRGEEIPYEPVGRPGQSETDDE